MTELYKFYYVNTDSSGIITIVFYALRMSEPHLLLQDPKPIDLTSTCTPTQSSENPTATNGPEPPSTNICTRAVDNYLSLLNFGIVALQENRLTCRTCDTKNYKWILGKCNDQMRTSRRNAFLVHVTYKQHVQKIHRVSPNILALEIVNANATVLLINVHLPQVTASTPDFDELRSFLTSKPNFPTILVGDLNAHLGSSDLTDKDKWYIGPNLYHSLYNTNGEELKTIIHMGQFAVKTTWNRSASLRTT